MGSKNCFVLHKDLVVGSMAMVDNTFANKKIAFFIMYKKYKK